MKRAFKLVWVSVFIIVLTAGIEEASPQSEITPTDKQEEVKPQNPSVRVIKYKVSQGDTLYSVAKKFRLPVEELKRFNGLKEDRLSVGQVLSVPFNIKRSRPIAIRQDEISSSQKQETETTNLETENKEIQAPTNDLETKEPEAQATAQEKLQVGEEVIKEKEVKAPEESPKQEGIPEEDVVNLQTEMDIRDLIQTVSEITGETFLLEESVKGKKVTVVAPRGGFKKQNALRLFEAILDLNGFAIVKKEGVSKIIPKRDIKIESLPTGSGIEYGSPSDMYVTRLVPLKNINAQEVANTLRPLISKEGDILAYAPLNTLIIVETVSNLNRILKIIENIDQETEIQFIKINHSYAADIAAKLVQIFGGESVTPTAESPQPGQQPQTPRRIPRATSSGGGAGQQTSGLKIITDERTNSLIVIAHHEDMGKIKAVIEKLDVEAETPELGIYVIRLQNADAEQVVSILSSLIGGGGGAVTQPSRPTTRTTGGFGGTLGSTYQGGRQTGGTVGAFEQAGQAIQRETDGGGFSAVVAEAEGVRITADPATNSVIIVGSRRDYETIKRVIDELDIRRRQVFVESAILEIAVDRIRALGTNFSAAFEFDGSAGFFGTALPGIPSLLGVAANPQSFLTSISSISGLFLGVVGESVDPDGSGPIPPIPSFTFLFQALASLTDVNVLSTPSIVTTDNEEAEIIVADVIPFPTGSTVGETGVTVQTIDREPVGIRLVLTPQISEGDFLNLNIHTEVSAVVPSPPDLNTDEFGIATNTRSADSSVIVKDGQTIVIGGLVQDRETVSESKVPLLGDVPLLGYLFKFKARRSTKINLLILLTPRIVESESDMQKLLEDRQRRNMLLQQQGVKREFPSE
ncbi:MAG: type II secretion system secretin GspD [Thermodesulfobacteriota bacterium]